MTHQPNRTSLAEAVTAIVCGSLTERAIVIGSLPPTGRDLDLLVRWAEHERLREALTRHELVQKGRTFARFADCSAYAVELIEAEKYLDAHALDDLFDSAVPVPGRAPLAQPGPAHALLIAARLMGEEGRLTAKRRARLERILAAEPRAWDQAAAAASDWGATEALDRLQREWRRPTGARRTPQRWVRAAGQQARYRISGHRRLLLVSFSGIDGSGKSSQARWWKDALVALGSDTEVIWNDLQGNVALDLVGRPVKLVLRLLGRQPPPLAQYGQADRPEPDVAKPGSAAKASRGGAVREIWSAFVTLMNATEQRLLATRCHLRNQVVVFDRGPLDLAVRMQVLYRTRSRWHRLVKHVAPHPDLAFLLRIPPELSRARKDDVWSASQLQEHAALYDELADQFEAWPLDGSQPPDELAALIARTVWQQIR